MALIAAAVLWIVSRPAEGREFDLWAFFALAVGFVIAESSAVELPFRRGGWTYAFGEVPLAVGLVLAEPLEVLGAGLVGYAIALILVLRVAPRKVVFNLAQGVLSTVVAISIVETVLGDADRLARESWPVILVAVVASTGISAVMVIAVLRSTDPEAPREKLVRTAAFSMLIAAANSAVALSATVVVDTQPLAAALLLIPTVALFVAYRSYVNEHTQREAIESLYSSSLALARRGGSDDSIAHMLSELSSMFRASVAEAIVRSPDAVEGAVTVTAIDGRIETSSSDPLLITDLERIGSAVPTEPVIVSAREPDERFDELVDRHGQQEAMIGRLEVGGRLLGVLVVAGPWGQARSFTRAELQLFGTLLHHASSAFENGRLEVAIDEMREIERRLAHEALHDPLTGLANRTRFSRELAAVAGSGAPGHALALIDLDDFKAVNDRLGHAVGDEVLVEVARRLVASLRSTDVAARLGGDEFAVLFAPEAELLPAAERMLGELGAPFEVADRPIEVGASIGVVRLGGVDDPERLLRIADAAMYAAKASGKGTVTEFHADAELLHPGRRSVAEELHGAADTGHIDLDFQPIIDLRTADLVGVEAFARWDVGGVPRPAADFLPELTSVGLVHEMDRLLVERTQSALRLVTPTGRGLPVWKNVSAASLRDSELVELLVSGLDADERSRLTVEVPVAEVGENAAVHDALERLAEQGVRIALDGISSRQGALPLLRPGTIDVFKVDASELGDGLAAVVAYAHALGASVVATGIETDIQLAAVRRLGCDRAQGRHLAAPMGHDELADYVAQTTAVTLR